MQRRKFIFLSITTTALALGSLDVFAADKHDHSPRHGGVVTETAHMDLELVVKPDVVQLFLSDHGKPLKLDGANAKVTLLAGTVKSEAVLAPTGDRLEARGVFKPAAGVKAVAVVTLPGKAPVTARFILK